MSEVDFRDGTLATPSKDDCMRSVSKVLHKLVTDAVGKIETAFDIHHFKTKSIQVVVPMIAKVIPFTAFYQLPEKTDIDIPTAELIFRFNKTIVDKLELSSECCIISLIYTERLMETGISFNSRNWRPILLASLLTASKVWDDLSSWNVEFSELFPIFPLKSINYLERLFLEGLKYNLFVSASVYARYYFALRALRGLEAKNIPKYYLNLGLGGAHKVEAKSVAAQAGNNEYIELDM